LLLENSCNSWIFLRRGSFYAAHVVETKFTAKKRNRVGFWIRKPKTSSRCFASELAGEVDCVHAGGLITSTIQLKAIPFVPDTSSRTHQAPHWLQERSEHCRPVKGAGHRQNHF
jgi:hypothetical protein